MVEITGGADLNPEASAHLVGHLVKSRQELANGEDAIAYDNVGDNVCFVKSPPMSALV